MRHGYSRTEYAMWGRQSKRPVSPAPVQAARCNCGAVATVRVGLGYPGGEQVLACCEADAAKWEALQARDGAPFRRLAVQS